MTDVNPLCYYLFDIVNRKQKRINAKKERILVRVKYKKIQKWGERCSLCDRYRMLFLIATLTVVCLAGCGAVRSDQTKDDPGEKAVDNPFFPKAAVNDSEVRYLLDMLSEGKATMQIQEELRGSDSVLYLVTYCDPREVSNREFELSSEDLKKKEEKWVKEELRDFYFYLWVTDTQIYYIPRFYLDEEELDDDHQKNRLVFYHEIPEYACLVCQEEEIDDTLEEMVEGEHQWIEKHGEDIRCYRSYTSRGEGYDTANIVQFIWKRGEGLIGIRCAAHPAGGDSQLFWKEDCLEVEDVAFSIDHDLDD